MHMQVHHNVEIKSASEYLSVLRLLWSLLRWPAVSRGRIHRNCLNVYLKIILKQK